MALTRHAEGSLRELIHIAIPLMLSSLSVTSMVFIDRLLLAHYSTQALNAATNATTLGWALVYSWMVLTSISEVFVAQYNGAGQKNKLGEPVWQMIWLSLFSILFFIPLGIWGSTWFYGTSSEHAMEREYVRWMVLFGPSYPLYGALCGFFVGQGKTRLVTIVAIVANLINAALDSVLIFGIEGYLQPLGVTGAAIATSGSSIFQAAILGCVFLNQKNRELYGTNCYKLKMKSFWQCIRFGLPGASFVAIELLGWASFYYMMTFMGERYITVAGISQSIVILLYFFAEGVHKAVSTIAGNLIGAQRPFLIPKIILAGVRLHLLFFVVILILFVFYTDIVIYHFLPAAEVEQVVALQGSIKTCLFLICVYLLFEGVRLLMSGVLTAAGDTFFLLVAGSLSIWVLLVFPVYLFIIKGGMSVEVASLICVFYSLGACFFYSWRFLTGKWKAISITT